MGQEQSYHQLSEEGGKSNRRSLRKLRKEESINTIACSETSAASSISSQQPLPAGIEEFYLKKRRRSIKNGLHWQEDPTGTTWLHNNLNWPRDFATIRGKVVQVKGKKWLLAKQVQQVNSSRWCKAPKGAALPFFYGNLYVLVPKKPYVPKEEQPKIVEFLRNERVLEQVVRFDTQPEVITIQSNSYDEEEHDEQDAAADALTSTEALADSEQQQQQADDDDDDLVVGRSRSWGEGFDSQISALGVLNEQLDAPESFDDGFVLDSTPPTEAAASERDEALANHQSEHDDDDESATIDAAADSAERRCEDALETPLEQQGNDSAALER